MINKNRYKGNEMLNYILNQINCEPLYVYINGGVNL